MLKIVSKDFIEYSFVQKDFFIIIYLVSSLEQRFANFPYSNKVNTKYEYDNINLKLLL